jgi:hypothetical protein
MRGISGVAASKRRPEVAPMLHLPSRELQDRLLLEPARVLRAGGVFAGTDSLATGFAFRLLHIGDTRVPVAPDELPERMRDAGLDGPRVDAAASRFASAHTSRLDCALPLIYVHVRRARGREAPRETRRHEAPSQGWLAEDPQDDRPGAQALSSATVQRPAPLRQFVLAGIESDSEGAQAAYDELRERSQVAGFAPRAMAR